MANDKNETRGHIIGFKEGIAASADSPDKFFGWFNNNASEQEAFINAAWDFSWYIAHPLSLVLGKSAHTLNALEIGCGGGRLLAHAARHFKHVVGIDIHDNFNLVDDKLKSMSIDNASLIQCDGRQIPCDDNSLDVVYSFIVFQHLEKIEILNNYVQEAARVLQPGGYALLYCARRSTFSFNRSSAFLYWLDCLLERLRLPQGYEEFPAPVNHTNLRVTISYMQRIAKKHGLQLMSVTPSRRNIPVTTKLYGSQHGLLFQKTL